MLSQLYDFHISAFARVPTSVKRYLFDRIDWSDRSILITGLRGVGKTVLLKQWALEQSLRPIHDYLYLTADHFLISKNGLYYTVAEYFRTEGGDTVIIDELQKYRGWQQEWKNLLDGYPGKRFFVTGSSSLLLKEADTDLKRRRAHYSLLTLSFREFLEFRWLITLPIVSVDDIMGEHIDLAIKTKQQLEKKGITIAKAFKEYLEFGCYPFFLESIESFKVKLFETVDAVIENDIRDAYDVKTEGTDVIKKLFAIIAASEPFTPNIEALSRELSLSRAYVERYLLYLYRADLIQLLSTHKNKSMKIAKEVKKITIANTNLQKCYAENVGMLESLGAIRECFFVNATKEYSPLVSSIGDYTLGSQIFEIGGKSKTRKQVKDHPDAFIVKDDIEIGSGRSIPLYLFGFLY